MSNPDLSGHDVHAAASPPFWRSPAGIGLAVLLAAAAFYLFTEHRARTFGVLPYLFLLACPLMHMFMHGGHHHHSHGPPNPARAHPDEPNPGGRHA